MRVHTIALVALFQQVPRVADKVFVSETRYPAPNTDIVSPPYVVIDPADGNDTTDRVAGPRLTQHPRFTWRAVGRDYTEAAALGEDLKALVIVNGFGIRLAVPGERTGPMSYSSPIPVQRDDDASPVVYFHVAEGGFESNPA